MTIFIYRDRFISNDEEILMEFIQEKVGMSHHSIRTVEILAEQQWAENVIEAPCSMTGLFAKMREGFIFIDMCGKEQ